MAEQSHFRLQLTVFALVSASFANIYITQPVLPVLQREFSADIVLVSFTVSAVILGIAIANLPIGYLSDRLAIHPIILTGGICVAAGGLICSATHSLWLLIGVRFVQGLFIPALTTCLAAYLAKTLPAQRLNVVMGSYVSATVLGGMGGRLLGGFVHPPLHWRYAFITAAVFILIATFIAYFSLPRRKTKTETPATKTGYIGLLRRWEILRILLCGLGSMALFSSIFNNLPFRLSGPLFGYSTEKITLLYLSYIVGIFMGPLAGRVANRFGSGATLIGGSLVAGFSLVLISIPSLIAVISGLLVLCGGFFTVHSSAVGALNRKLSGGHGRANALYVLFYYLGGWTGITITGCALQKFGWTALIGACACFLIIPFSAGISERRGRG